MLLGQFTEEFPVKDQKLNVVICIFQKDISMIDKSPLNQMLEELQFELKEELDQYSEIQVAYVFEDKSLAVRGFEKLEKDTPVYYKEPSKHYNLAHIWMLGMALLEQKQQEEKNVAIDVENRLYLVTDEKLQRDKVRLIVYEEGGEIYMHTRFSKVDFQPFLWRSEDAYGDILEEFIRKKGKGKGIHILKRGK